MSKHLLIVESPAKSRTIEKYLGGDFRVMATYGHIRDLVAKDGAVDPASDFRMKYQPIEKNKKHVDAIVKALKDSDSLYLATDPDREGEAISWHLRELLQARRALDGKPVRRVVFYEITKRAIQEALRNPRTLADDLIDAQQARRALDHLVGFHLSPLLWRKISGGLSAGRVQSPALRMIVEREQEIERFKPREYWTIEARLEKDGQAYVARLHARDGKKLEQFDLDADAANHARDEIEAAAKDGVPVAEVRRAQKKRNPAPPFITSTLQQEAARKLGFASRRTMRVAQQLYEGGIGGETDGLITYMRTDSVALAGEAVSAMRAHIKSQYGEDQVPDAPRVFKSKSKNAQEAHEAIRPTDVTRTPERLARALDADQARLYELIWKRAVASQMRHATIDTVSADHACGEYTLRATGSTIREPGFMRLYIEGADDARKNGDAERMLPDLREGDRVDMREVEANQHFTEPPPRYTEASLIKTLEGHGIGRPSTYAAIISTLNDREYVEMDRKRFIPTHTGRLVGKFLTEHFPSYVDYEFTAKLEDQLDDIANGKKGWVPVMRGFWEKFKAQVDEKQDISKAEVGGERPLGDDPATGKPVSVKYGRYGPYAQLGSRDDEEKPRFASLRDEQKVETISLEEALELFKLPRDLGETPDGEAVRIGVGRYGPYVKYGARYVSLQEGDDPYTVTLERALELIDEKKRADAQKLIQDYPKEGIRVLRGRYGPYVTDGEKNATVPKDREPEDLTLEDCQALLAEAKKRPARKKRRAAPRKKSRAAQ